MIYLYHYLGHEGGLQSMDGPFYIKNYIPVITDGTQKCYTIKYEDPSFPLICYHENPNPSNAELHWHPEVQMAIVCKGSLTLHIQGTQYRIQEGDGYFINSNTLHYIVPDPLPEIPTILGFICLPQLIAGEGTYLFNKYVEPFVNRPQYAFLHLKKGCPWQKSILSKLRQLQPWMNSKNELAEMNLRNLVSEIWVQLYKKREEFIQKGTTTAHHASLLRLSQMCSYIQTNYAQPIGLDEIAKSASVSISEANRCFKDNMSMTPYEYLTNYRIMKAKYLLATTNESILNIALQCGFNQSSYFSEIFRKKTGMLPSKYRKTIPTKSLHSYHD